MNRTEASQRAKNAPPECLLLNPSTQVFWSPVRVQLDGRMARRPKRAMHVWTVGVAYADPGAAQAVTITFADEKSFTRPISNGFHGNFAFGPENTVVGATQHVPIPAGAARAIRACRRLLASSVDRSLDSQVVRRRRLEECRRISAIEMPLPGVAFEISDLERIFRIRDGTKSRRRIRRAAENRERASAAAPAPFRLLQIRRPDYASSSLWR